MAFLNYLLPPPESDLEKWPEDRYRTRTGGDTLPNLFKFYHTVEYQYFIMFTFI